MPRRPIGGFLFGRLGTRRIGLSRVVKLTRPLGLAGLALLQPLPRLLGQSGIGLLLGRFSHWHLRSISLRALGAWACNAIAGIPLAPIVVTWSR